MTLDRLFTTAPKPGRTRDDFAVMLDGMRLFTMGLVRTGPKLR